MRELLTNYGPICLIWFDTPMYIKDEQSRELLDLVHTLHQTAWCAGAWAMPSSNYASARDNRIPGQRIAVDWETPATINDTWGYKLNDHNWKTEVDLVQKLVDIASKGGNYLLNIGPQADGTIPAPSVERLETMGAWLAVNGEAISATRPGRCRTSLACAPPPAREDLSACLRLAGERGTAGDRAAGCPTQSLFVGRCPAPPAAVCAAG